MRNSELSRLANPASASAATTVGEQSQPEKGAARAKRAIRPDPPAPGPELARFAAEERGVAPSTTALHPSTVKESLKSAFVTVDAVSLCEMAHHSVSGGKLAATVPLRAGTVSLDIGKDEPIQLRVSPGTIATVSAKLKPTSKGLLLCDVSIDFSKPLEVLNPGLLLGGGLVGSFVSGAVGVKIKRLAIDAAGQLQPYGILKKPIFGESPLENAIPTAVLPRYDLHLNRFFGGGKPSSLPKLPTMDPRQLIATLGGMVEKADFKLELNGAAETVKIGTDGAEIQSPAGRGTLKLAGALARDVSGALTGKTSGKLDASIAATIALKPTENAIAANGMTIAYRDQRLVVDAGDLQICRAIAGQLSVFVGDSLSLDAKTSADVSSELKIAFAKDGSLSVTANNVEATLGLNDAAAASPRFTLALGNPSSATFKLAELAVGKTGIVARGADGSIDVKVQGGQLDLGGNKLTVRPGKIGINAKAESVESGGSASLVLDLPLEAQVSWPALSK
ncbi:MAG: hypothetical protein ACAI38_11320 [Myxococcota bacterium]|nr:hypothetical protein [Myxococcota bacterium]